MLSLNLNRSPPSCLIALSYGDVISRLDICVEQLCLIKWPQKRSSWRENLKHLQKSEEKKTLDNFKEGSTECILQ